MIEFWFSGYVTSLETAIMTTSRGFSKPAQMSLNVHLFCAILMSALERINRALARQQPVVANLISSTI